MSVNSIIQVPKGILTGATYPLRALALFRTTPELRSYVLVPILVNLVVGITLYAGLLLAGFQAIATITASLPNWLADLSNWHFNPPGWVPDLHLPSWNPTLPGWVPNLQLPDWHFNPPGWLNSIPHFVAIILGWLLHAVLVIVLLLITGFILLQFGVFLGAPWYGKLSEELEKRQTGHVPTPEASALGVVGDVGRSLFYELKKLTLTAGIGLPLLLLQLFPGPGTAIATLGGIALATTIVCLDFLEPALERRRLKFREKLGVLSRTLPASATFGLVCLGLVSIPLLNLLAIPVCVGAGTLFFCDQVLLQLQPSKKPESML